MKPEIVRALRELEHPDGSLLADEVCAAAKSVDNPLHGYFTWDDRAAAAKYRLEQAEALIRRYKIEIVVRPPSGEGEYSVLTRGYAAASRAGIKAPAGTYRPIGSLSGSEQKILLQTMYREVEALRRRYGHLAEFWEAIAELGAQAPERAAASGS